MQCSQCGKQWPDTYKVCPECVLPLPGVDTGTVVKKQTSMEPAPWGARINERWGAKDYPSWANKHQQEKWCETGLLLWDNTTHQVTRLTASQAFSVLEHLRTHEEWKEEGANFGEPATRISLDDPEHKGEPVLLNQISLTAAQVQELFKLLQRDEMILQKMKAEEEQEISKQLYQAYRHLLGNEVWSALGQLYQTEPERALELGKEIMAKALGK